MSNQPGVLVKDVALSLCIHPFMLSKWRKQMRDGVPKGSRRCLPLMSNVECHGQFVKLDGFGSTSVLEGFTKRLRMDVFFCDQHNPWQRGSNENANGLIREYRPKGMDLSKVTRAQLTAIEHSLNNRPRAILGFLTPNEVFDQLKAQPHRRCCASSLRPPSDCAPWIARARSCTVHLG
jgi:hypothetical protein